MFARLAKRPGIGRLHPGRAAPGPAISPNDRGWAARAARRRLPALVSVDTGNRGNDRQKGLSLRANRAAYNDLEATLSAVGGSLDGLVELEAAERLTRNGPNEVAHEKPAHWLAQLLACFKDPFIVVLAVLAVIQYVSDPEELKPVIIVCVMVAVSVGLRFWQEYRSALAAEKLKALASTTATVMRRAGEGMPAEAREIPIQELVVGDVVRLSAGDMVPADARLISSRDLFVSQAALTGEALPVEKHDTLGAVVEKSAHGGAVEAVEAEGILDFGNICFMGTNVVSGTATAVVVATGARTYFGSLAKSVIGQRAQTSFDRGVNSVSWVLIRFMLIMVPVVLLINGFAKGDWLEALLFAVSVAVGLTPEMLPMIVSANLAKGALAMAKHKSSSSVSMRSRTLARWTCCAPTRPARSPRTGSFSSIISTPPGTRTSRCSTSPGSTATTRPASRTCWTSPSSTSPASSVTSAQRSSTRRSTSCRSTSSDAACR
jgi:P-type Mg2+ transporter